LLSHRSLNGVKSFFTTVNTINNFLETVKSLPSGINFGSISFGNAASPANKPVETPKTATEVKNKISENPQNSKFLQYSMNVGVGIKFDIYENPSQLLKLFTITTGNLEPLKNIKFFSVTASASASISASKSWTLFQFNCIDVSINFKAGNGVAKDN